MDNAFTPFIQLSVRFYTEIIIIVFKNSIEIDKQAENGSVISTGLAPPNAVSEGNLWSPSASAYSAKVVVFLWGHRKLA